MLKLFFLLKVIIKDILSYCFKYWFYILGLLSIITIGTALIAEHFYNLEPCKMCLKQREPYYILIGAFIIFGLLKWQKKIWFFFGVQIISIYGLFYALWHVAIEKNILSGSSECSGGLDMVDSTSSLKEQILSKTVINCEEVIWSILGLSAATINSLLLFLIFLINAIYLFNNYGSKKKID